MNFKRLAWLASLLLILAPPALACFKSRTVVPVASAAAVPAVVPPQELSTIYFEAGITQLRPRDMRVLDGLAVWQRDERKRVLVIEGHTDGPAESERGREIGRRRARSAKAYLVTRGAIADHITIESHGGARPRCQAKTPACRALNRRATVSRQVGP